MTCHSRRRASRLPSAFNCHSPRGLLFNPPEDVVVSEGCTRRGVFPERFFSIPPSMSVQYPRTYFLNARGVLRGVFAVQVGIRPFILSDVPLLVNEQRIPKRPRSALTQATSALSYE